MPVRAIPAAARVRKSTTARATRKTRRQGLVPGDLLRMVFASSPRISPDGRRVVFVHRQANPRNDYASHLWMADCDGGPIVQFTSGGKDGAPRWSPDGSRIAFVRKPENGSAQLHLIDPAGGEARALTRFPEGTIASYRWSPDGSALAVSFREQDPDWTEGVKKKRDAEGLGEPPRVIDDWWYRLDGDGYFGAQRHRLHLVDAASGTHRLVYGEDTLGGFSFDFSPDGAKLAVTTNRDPKALIRPWKDEILIVTLASGTVRRVPKLPRGPKGSVAWSPDGAHLAYAGRVGDDSAYGVENLELFVCDPTSGKAKSLTAREDHCLMAMPITDTAEIEFTANLHWSPDSRRVYFKLGHHGECHVASVALRGQGIQVHTSGSFDHDLGNLSRDGARFALVRSAADRPAEIHLGERDGETIRVRALTDLNGSLRKRIRFAPLRSEWLATPDRTKVQTWVILPPHHAARSRRRYPAVLEIHGGPHTQYGVGFFFEFQLLAAHGYAVFFSNPRGSKGYGRDHCAAIRGRWGTSDWTDIETVARFMRDHPNVDSMRMGVMGGSYGGYMTNWTIGHTRAFAAAITDRCVSNVVTMGGTSDFPDDPDRYFPGNFWDRAEERWEQSPIKHIGKCRTPTLILHSEGDLRCNIEQAEQLFMALKLLNVPTRFVRYPRSTSHGMSRGGPPHLRVHRLEQILDWWRRYLRSTATSAS